MRAPPSEETTMKRFNTMAIRTATAIGVLALAGTAFANEEKWQKLDTNGDGMISAQEHDAGATAMFQEADADGNGSVTATEMEAAHAAKGGEHGKSSAEMIQKMDTDGDGAVSASEHAAGAQERSEEHTSELQSLMRISYAVFCLKK